MYKYLKDITTQPEPFSKYTAADLWNDDYISSQMLKHHLEPSHDIASRRPEKIKEVVEFLVDALNIEKKTRIADFGCGPGLYTMELSGYSNHITGIDFSKRSIEYACSVATESKLNINYIEANYLEYNFDTEFDLALMIFFDYAVLSPKQRKALLVKIHKTLSQDGAFVFDLQALASFEEKEEALQIEHNLMSNFWSKEDYFGIMQTFKYPDINLALDRYDIHTSGDVKTIYNWFQFFSLGDIRQELSQAGFDLFLSVDRVNGNQVTDSSKEMFLIAKKK